MRALFVLVDVVIVALGIAAAFYYDGACRDVGGDSSLLRLFKAIVVINAIGTGTSACTLCSWLSCGSRDHRAGVDEVRAAALWCHCTGFVTCP
jgi:hypothetical protein